MGYFIDKFSSPLSGPCCPVAVDDIREKVRYPLMPKGAIEIKNPEKFWPSWLYGMELWEDYPA